MLSTAQSTQLTKLSTLLDQIYNTLEWQVGTDIPAVDFVFPKIKQATVLLEAVLTGDNEDFSESTTREQLEQHYAAHNQYVFSFSANEEDPD